MKAHMERAEDLGRARAQGGYHAARLGDRRDGRIAGGIGAEVCCCAAVHIAVEVKTLSGTECQ